jgi:cell division initiation protein
MTFRTRFRGYDAEEVETALTRLADQVEAMIRDHNALKAQCEEQGSTIAELRKMETTLTSTLVAAQKMSEEMKVVAKKEGEMLIRQAELRAEEITATAVRQVNQLQGEILNLLKQRGLFIERIRSLMQSLEKTLQWETEKSGGTTGSGDQR